MGKTGTTIRRLAVAAVGAVSLIGLTGPAEAQPEPTAAPAAAAAPVVTGVEMKFSTQQTDEGHYKYARAVCPTGKKVIGGGGTVGGSGAPGAALTALQPLASVDGRGTGGYFAGAATASPGGSDDWEVQAYVMCADAASLPGWHINVEDTDPTSDPPVQRTAAGCDDPSRQRVIGTGARIDIADGYEGQAVLQVARTSGSGDIARAQSHEDANGYGGIHRLAAYAICMNTPQGYDVVPEESGMRASEPFKFVAAVCGSGKQLLGVGGATSANASGHVSLHWIQPYPNNRLYVAAHEHTPTDEDWDFIVAHAICVDAA